MTPTLCCRWSSASDYGELGTDTVSAKVLADDDVKVQLTQEVEELKEATKVTTASLPFLLDSSLSIL